MSRAYFGAFGKRCHVQTCCFRQKVSRPDEGRISRAPGALEQAYQNFCTNSREAGSLPFHHHLLGLTEALVIYPKKSFLHTLGEARGPFLSCVRVCSLPSSKPVQHWLAERFCKL